MKDWLVDTASEAEYKRTHPSNREAKYYKIREELVWWCFVSPEMDESALKAIAGELPWRMVMRIVNKLRRKRNADKTEAFKYN